MSSLEKTGKDSSPARWSARAQVVVGTTQHRFTHRWTTSQSTASRMLLVPVFLGFALLSLLVLAVFVAALAVAAAALVVARMGRAFTRPGSRR